MAQPVQITTGLSHGDYVVIDNGAAGNNGNQNGLSSPLTTSIAGAAGYDNAANGAVAQDTNFKANGTIPDFLSSGKTFTTTTAACVPPNIISFKLPS